MIIFGAANHIPVVMIAGIIMTAFDFYACPILWINFGGVVALKAVVKAVEEENLYTAEEIAVQQNKEVKIVVNQIRTCMQKGYIKGYLFDGKYVFPKKEFRANSPTPSNVETTQPIS